MNLEESRILKDAIRAVRCHNEHAWWQLKRETFEYGLQTYYPAQSMFELPAKTVTNALNNAQLAQLRQARSGAHDVSGDDKQLVAHYVGVIVAEIVRRARIAAYRTENW